MLLRYFLLAVVMGFLGTIIESAVVSLQKGRFVYRGAKYLWNLPVKPIYAVGGVIMYFIIKWSVFKWYITIPGTVATLTIWEYVGGWFCVNVLHKRLWDYRKRRFNLDGHISLWSVSWWLVLVTVFYFYFFEWFDYFVNIVG